MKYRKRREIEAVQWFEVTEDIPEVIDYPAYNGYALCEQCQEPLHAHGLITGQRLSYPVCPGDYIYKDTNGLSKVAKQHTFELLFEPHKPGNMPTS